MPAIPRKCALRPDVGASAAKFLHSAAKRMHVSSRFRVFSDSDTALLLKGGSACLSQSSAGQKKVPVMKSRWGRVGYLARVIFPIFEHVHGITDLLKSIRQRPLARSPRHAVDRVGAQARPRPGLGFRLTQALTWTPRTSACAAGGSSIKIHQLVLCGSPKLKWVILCRSALFT